DKCHQRPLLRRQRCRRRKLLQLRQDSRTRRSPHSHTRPGRADDRSLTRRHPRLNPRRRHRRLLRAHFLPVPTHHPDPHRRRHRPPPPPRNPPPALPPPAPPIHSPLFHPRQRLRIRVARERSVNHPVQFVTLPIHSF